MKKASYILLFCGSLLTYPVISQIPKDTLLYKELLEMAQRDQKIQEDFLMANSDTAKQTIKEQMQQTFDANCHRIKEVFQKQGYLGWDKVGKEGAHSFWLLVQHCDSDHGFQEAVLKAMEKQARSNNADKGEYAYLLDRVRVNGGQKQVYGTQMEVKDILEGYSPKPLENPEQVNKRRQEMGLMPLEEYLKKMNESFFTLNKDKIEQERRRRQQSNEH